jgi:hypothetical protein
MIRQVIFTILVLATTISSHADLISDFAAINGGSGFKGPFGSNVLQGEAGRTNVRDGGLPPGKFLFQAAFRNDGARALALNNDFYVGNLFTTNFYELMGEFVYNNAFGSHVLDHNRLLQNGQRALPKASSMVRHWVLEKHFIRNFPATVLARGFLLRGISDFANEQTFTSYFLDFFMTTLTDEYQYLPALLLAKASPIVSSSSLEKARVDIAVLYDNLKASMGEKDPGVLKLYKLRNAIHNQLSVSVIAQIDSFLAAHPTYGRDVLVSIRDSLKVYYSTNAKKVADLARKFAGFNGVAQAAGAIVQGGANPTLLLKLSAEVAALRSNILNESVVPYNNKTQALVLISSAAQYLNKEINSMASITSKEVVAALVNTVYSEGFLIKDNWQYFLGEVNAAATAPAAAAVFADMTDIASDTLLQAFKPAFEQWLQVEPKMEYFVDNTIKSSALNTASTVLPRIK